MAHVSDARSAKSSFQLRKVMSLAQQTASSSVGKGRSDNPEPWQAVGEYVEQVLKEINSVLPQAMEAENTMKSKFPVPRTNAT
jgi:dynactin 1